MNPPIELNPARLAIVIPVLNQLNHTRACLDTLQADGITDEQIIIINNASTDGTREFLAARPRIRSLHNESNRGCGFAWNQGAKISTATWTVIANNDILVPPGCLAGLVRFAEEQNIDVASPAMCEGEADYDWLAYAADYMRRMAPVCRRNVATGSLFMVHRRVFEAIGYFDEDPKLGGYEDDEFSRRCRRHGFRLAITGQAYYHHFGSATQKSLKASLNQPNMSLGDRAYYRRKTGQTWSKRKWNQIRQTIVANWWKKSEYYRHGHTLHEKRSAGKLFYC